MKLDRTIEERDFINREFRFFKTYHLRELENMHANGTISYSRLIEHINEIAYDFYIGKKKLKK